MCVLPHNFIKINWSNISMTLDQYISNIKLILSGDVLNLEIDDAVIGSMVEDSLRELQRYIDSTVFITVPYQECIDVTEFNISSVSRVYRTEGEINGCSETSLSDPMQFGIWNSTGGIYNQTLFSNLVAYKLTQQITTTLKTDLPFMYDKASNKLYISVSMGRPSNITIEYVPKFNSVDEIVSDFWCDILHRMALAKTKIILGRIRSRFTQSNALWVQDGAQMLSEGSTELSELRAQLQASTQLVYPVD